MRRVVDEWLAPFRRRGIYIAWVSLSLIAALVGPFGTYDLLDPPRRLMLWGAAVALVLVTGAFLRGLVRGIPGLANTRLAGLATAALLALILAVPCSRLVAWFTPHEPTKHSTAEIGASLFFSTLAASALTGIRHRPGAVRAPGPPSFQVASVAEAGPPTDRTAPDAMQPRLLRRLDPALRGRLVSISVRDHYVDVVTEAGRSSLLMRLSDAMAEAEGEEGARIHRSHWVARHAARSLLRDGTRLSLLLVDGNRLPVSRQQRAQIETWGLIESVPSEPEDTTA